MQKLISFILLSLICVYASLFGDPNHFTAITKNSSHVDSNIKEVTFVSVPFSGHFNILMLSALELAADPQLNIRFIITGWENISIGEEKLKQLQNAGIKTFIVNDKLLASSAPMEFTFPRVAHLTDEVIDRTRASDLIIYDFFAIEGFLAGHYWNIPTFCSIPAIIGPFNADNPDFQKALVSNKSIIEGLEDKFHITLMNKIEMVSDAFLLPSPTENIIFSWSKFISATDYLQNRHLNSVSFIRPENTATQKDLPLDLKPGQKLIYVSLGTVVTKNLWDNIPAVQTFVRAIFQELERGFGNKDDFVVVISTGRQAHEVLPNPPSNFYVCEEVSQLELLKRADVFITHAGGNSVNEAINESVPMIAIPFFGDQHISALNIENLKIGHAFLHAPEHREQVVNTQLGRFERSSLNLKNMPLLTASILNVLKDDSIKKRLVEIKSAPLETLQSHIKANFVLQWKEGDLLCGINKDRKAFAEKFGLANYFKIGDLRSFSAHCMGQSNCEALPRIIDQYNDVLRSSEMLTEIQHPDLKRYSQVLLELDRYFSEHPNYLQPMGRYPETLSEDDQDSLETIWNMCLGGLDFFTSKTDFTVHFVIKDYNCQINKATTKELNWIKARWHTQPNFQKHFKFYLMAEETIQMVNPEEYGWFQNEKSNEK